MNLVGEVSPSPSFYMKGKQQQGHFNGHGGRRCYVCLPLPRCSADASVVLLQVGWVGLKSLYANVASTVESVAKDSGYKIDLGSKAVASSLEQQRFEQQMRANGGYEGFGSDSYGSNGAGGYGSSGHGVHKSASEGTGLGGQHAYGSGSPQQQRQQQQGAGGYGSAPRSNGNGFGGFDDGADGE
jgi:hypothetical protein